MADERSDLKAAIILISSTLLLIVSHYHTLLGDQTLSAAVFYFLIPLAIVLGLREDPRRFGLTVGDWRRGLLFSIVGVVVIALVIVGLAQLDEFRVYYASSFFEGQQPGPILEFALRQGIYMFSWEFIFRGFMLFGLKERFGSLAIWIQAIPFAIMHLGKPELETLSTIFGGAAFGYVDLKSRSILPSVVIHWAIYMIMVAAASWA